MMIFDQIAGSRRELQNLIVCLEKAAGPFGMEVSAEKTRSWSALDLLVNTPPSK